MAGLKLPLHEAVPPQMYYFAFLLVELCEVPLCLVVVRQSPLLCQLLFPVSYHQQTCPGFKEDWTQYWPLAYITSDFLQLYGV